MNWNWKKILTIVGFIVAVLLIALAIYFTFFRKAAPPLVITVPPEFPGVLPTTPPGVPLPPGVVLPPGVLPTVPGIFIPPAITAPIIPTLSTIAEGGIVVPNKLVDADAKFAKLSANGSSMNYYDSATGLFSKVNPDGSMSLLSNKIFPNVQKATWAPTADKAVVEMADGNKMIYDFINDTSYSVPNQFADFSFSPDSKSIAAKDLKAITDERWLVTIDDKGRNKQFIEHLGENESRVKVQWNPNDQIIGTSAKSLSGELAEVIFLTKDGTKLAKATIQGRDFRYTYSEDGNKIAYSVYNPNSNFLPTLWITSTDPRYIDEGRLNTGLNTWADKCAYQGNDFIYCAVPKEISPYAGILPNQNDSPDNIYRINARTGESVMIAEPISRVTIGSISVSKNGENLFYTETDSGAINKLQLQ